MEPQAGAGPSGDTHCSELDTFLARAEAFLSERTEPVPVGLCADVGSRQ